MEKEDKSFLALLAFFTITLSIIAVLALYLVSNRYHNNVTIEVQPVEIRPEPITVTKQKTVFELSIDYCNYYYAEDLARAVYVYARKENIPVFECYALFETESELKLNPRNRKGLPYYGLGQIGKGAIDDYNRVHGTNYTISDALVLETNVMISLWYFRWCADRALALYENPTWSDAYLIYNAGYGMVKRDPQGYRDGVYTGGALSRFKYYSSVCYNQIQG